MSSKKIIFFAVTIVLILTIGIGLALLSNKNNSAGGQKWPAEITVWVVGDDTAGYDPIVKEFQNNETYKNTNVVFYKFASYQDYESALINAIADGHSPDVFVVPSTGADLLQSKTELVSSSHFDVSDISRNLNKLFDPLISISVGKSAEWKEIQLTSLKGVALWYETMGAFYNRDLLETSMASDSGEATEWGVPGNWEDFDSKFKNSDLLPPVALGLSGKYITKAADILSLMLVQNGLESYSKISQSEWNKALSQYLSYAGDPTDSSTSKLWAIKSEMDTKNLSMTDLFAQGKVSVIFGFPSIMREIQYSIKRSRSDSVLNENNLRSAPVPQSAPPAKKLNVARYNYFAVSKYTPNPEAASDFVGFLSTKKATDLYAQSFPQYLPARNDVASAYKETPIDKSFPWVRHDSFVPADGTTLVNFDQGLTSEFPEAFDRAFLKNTDPQSILSDIFKQVECRKKQLIEGAGFEVSCRE